SIVADFREGLRKSDFIQSVTNTQIYDRQPYTSRNFGYQEVLKSEFLQVGYIELAGEMKGIDIDLQKLIFHRIRLEMEIERESKRREHGEAMLSNEEYQRLFENKEDIQALIEQTNEEGMLTDRHKIEYHKKHIEVSLRELQSILQSTADEIDEIYANVDFSIQSMRRYHEKHLYALHEKRRILQKQIQTKQIELEMDAEKMCLLDEEGFLPYTKKTTRKHLIKAVRFEFNPKYMKCNPIVNESIRHVLGLLENIEVTGIHIALDYAVNISDLKIRDLSSKTEYMILSRDKTLETLYIGVRSSDNCLCIYNKKKEAEQNGSIDPYPDIEYVTRFEARLRKKKTLELWEEDWTPFDNIIVSTLQQLGQMNLKLNDKIILDAIMSDKYGRYWGMMDKYQKTAWRKKMKDLVPKKLDIAKDFSKKKKSLSEELNDLLNGSMLHTMFTNIEPSN
ncbi:replication initiation factor domain-containing protein, partial [Bacillus cereus group sp. IBL03679]